MGRKLLAPLWKYPRETARALFRSIFFGVFGIWMGYLVKDIVDGVIAGNGLSILRPYLLIIFLLHFFKDVFGHFFRNNKFQLNNLIQQDLYKAYMHKYLYSDPYSTEFLGTGKVNSILQKGCDQWVRLLDQLAYDFFSVFLSIILAILVIGSHFGFVGLLISLLITGLITRTTHLTQKQLFAIRKEKKEITTEADRHIVRTIMHKQEVMQNQKIATELTTQSSFFGRIGKLLTRESLGMKLFFDFPRGITSLLRIGIIVYSVWGISHGTMSLGTFTLLWMVAGQLNQELWRLTDRLIAIQQQMIHINKLRDTFDELPSLDGYETGRPFQIRTSKISFNTISFQYTTTNTTTQQTKDVPVFDNFSLDLPAQKKIAFVGPSGSGKTTLIKLIAGYLRPQQGQVMVDGQDLNDVALKTYYQHIGYLTQEPSIFDGMIRENLEYGISKDSKQVDDTQHLEHLFHVLTLAKCEWVNDLPQGVDTEIGERGIRLSGGQRQRLAIAKIMLKNPDIILLDEPTSALDSANEKAVTEALNNLFHGKTVIIIAHRLQTVKHADDIIYLADGKVLERGTHEELLSQQGEYYQMVELQSGF